MRGTGKLLIRRWAGVETNGIEGGSDRRDITGDGNLARLHIERGVGVQRARASVMLARQ